jgi:hypothetical protein
MLELSRLAIISLEVILKILFTSGVVIVISC